MAVMIGVDPHKASHTAVAIDDKERPLGELRVRSSPGQLEQLLSWAAQWPQRTWAVEGAGGLGYLLAQQLVSAGETVLDVQPKLGSRVRLLATGNINKNDPDDARSVAVAALRSKDVRPVVAEDHAAVLKLWSKRRRDLGSLRTQVVCRLHSVLCDLVPGGHGKKEITASQAAHILSDLKPVGSVQAARYELALDFLADMRRFADRDHFAAYNGTAPIEVSSGGHKVFRLSRRGNRRLNHAVHMAAVTQIRFRQSEGRAYHDRKIKEGKSHKEALRCLKRRVSDAIFAHLVADAKRKAEGVTAGPGGQRGNGSASSVAGSHPERQLFGQATPGPVPTIGPGATRRSSEAQEPVRKKSRRAS